MTTISQTTFSNAFSWMKIFTYRLKFHWNLFPRVQLTVFEHWFRLWLVEKLAWRRNQMETFSALLAICAGNSPASGEFPAQRPVTRSFDVFFDLCLNKRLRKQSLGWWFQMLSRPLWRHRNGQEQNDDPLQTTFSNVVYLMKILVF